MAYNRKRMLAAAARRREDRRAKKHERLARLAAHGDVWQKRAMHGVRAPEQRPAQWKAMRARLRELGMTYRRYLASDHWKGVKARYRATTLMQACAACGDPRYQLHHKTYERLGCERLSDLIPLCDSCHVKVHEYHRWFKGGFGDINAALGFFFGLSPGEVGRRLANCRLLTGD